ncbi:low-complexity protein [Nostoc sp. 'Peltigera membranacea cyanobiont' 213]|uniref:pentapeptide repeat-containing protein n=1 Tax=Nostoc sp. 'Peltigera membranacea cyanobiont' 213 TaxID=2014530 RepID=UPI000B9575E1|nr:pentapeptide repeat-containing protein [Nostoc sp. 'Peltigera membranacea cyanobiont' 213]OYD87550.1 low-complexity protein [Nostoc sp. 'Peltigera membranacea cyanobiont' 213]
MTSPIVRRSSSNQSGQSKEPERASSLLLASRRFAAWAAEITLVVASGLIPFGLGVYANSRSDLNRVPLNPVLVVTERAIARPLALPVSYGIRNVAWPTNILWTIALLAPVTLSWWQLYLLAKTGNTIPKRWFKVRVVNEQGKSPGLGAVVIREGVGRWTVPISIAYLLWRYSFAFPNLGLFTFLSLLMIVGEGIGLPSRRGRRALHDRLAGTYTIDTTRPLPSSLLASKRQAQSAGGNDEAEEWPEGEELAADEINQSPNLWRRIQQNPNLTLFGVGLTSMTAVLATLIGTQVYIQIQQSQRATKQINGQQFLELVKQLSPNSGATNEQRQSAILAMGGLNDPQSIKFLADLLVSETNPSLLDTIQQALTTVGPQAIPELKNKNQFLVGELESVGSTATQERDLRQGRLQRNQRTINKILSVYSGKMEGVDLSSTQLGQSGTPGGSFFNLVLDNLDLSGVKFKSANLNQASFKGSRFRGAGEDGRWDTYDDVMADLSQAQLQQANLTDANLSRVLMNRIDLSRATLNRANLSNARLYDAKLNSTQLVGADLRNAVLERASLTGADLGDAKLNEANLYAARLGRVTAIGTQLSFANLTNTDWQGADLSGAYLDRANLSNANLSATRLAGAVLRSAQMENVNLQNADLSLADLRGANVAGADFKGAILAPSKEDPADQFVKTPDLGSVSAVIQGVDFSQAKNLDAKQLAYICTQGGIHPRCP